MVKSAKPQNGNASPHERDSSPIDRVNHSQESEDLSLNILPDPKLVADGWERRFIADPPRAKEAIQLYTELGFEVLAAPVIESELDSECADCKLVVNRLFVTIYTRKPIQDNKGLHG